jgi:DNA modification methylase
MEIKIKSNEIKLVPLAQIILNPNNNNRHSIEQINRISEIIKYQGFRRPLTISNRSGFVVCGEGRYLAAKKLKMDYVPVIYQDYENEAQEYADLTADNALQEWSEIDVHAVHERIKELPDLNIDMLGFESLDFSTESDEGKKEEDKTLEPPRIPITKSGDLWVLGGHRLLCGDSTSTYNVNKLMNSEKADIVLTDPPYNIASHSTNYVGKSTNGLRKTLTDLSEADWDKNFDIKKVLPNLLYFSKADCSYYVFTSQFIIHDILDFFNSSNLDHVSYNIWFKKNPMPSLTKRRWTFSSELCAHATRGKHIFNFPEAGHAFSVWEFNQKTDGIHPTQKPLKLIEHILSHSSNEGSTVMDLFGGSGTILIASERLKRICYSMEIDPIYCDVTLERFFNLTGIDPIRHDGKKFSELKASKNE